MPFIYNITSDEFEIKKKILLKKCEQFSQIFSYLATTINTFFLYVMFYSERVQTIDYKNKISAMNF